VAAVQGLGAAGPVCKVRGSVLRRWILDAVVEKCIFTPACQLHVTCSDSGLEDRRHCRVLGTSHIEAV
jgi:hypothetical protein